MENKETFSAKARLKSFKYAFNGFRHLILNEHNARIHLLATVIVMAAIFLFHLTKMEATAVIIVVGMVWMAELFNSSIEKSMDFISSDHHPRIKIIKDLAAAAVLVAAITALITGVIVFGPRIIVLFQ
jgi:diacylglycerol kinase